MRFVRGFVVFLFWFSQVFAPLVHAHVGADFSPAAIHLPGLETAGLHPGLSASAALDHPGGLVVRAAEGVRSWPPGSAPGTVAILPGDVFSGVPHIHTVPAVPSTLPVRGFCHPLIPPSRAPPEQA